MPKPPSTDLIHQVAMAPVHLRSDMRMAGAAMKTHQDGRDGCLCWECRATNGEKPGERCLEAFYPRVAGGVQTHRHLTNAPPGQQQVETLTVDLRTT
jgi:hypothetical protein